LVEFGITCHFPRNKIRCGQPGIINRAAAAPFRKLVTGSHLPHRFGGRGAAKRDPVTGGDQDIASTADEPGSPGKEGDTRHLVSDAGVDIVASLLLQPEPTERSIDLQSFAGVKATNVEVDPAFPDRDLGDQPVEFEDRNLGAFSKIDRVGADTNFGARLRPSAQRHPGRDRVIDGCRRPLRFIRSAVLNLPRGKADPTDAARRRHDVRTRRQRLA
jgi:hypothetical protein